MQLSPEVAAQILLLRRLARKNLVSFTEYTNPKYVAAAHHYRIAEELELVERGVTDRLMLLTAPRHGKALEIKTPIPTPEGWTEIGKLRPGDKIFADTGEVCSVVGVSPVWENRQLYDLFTDDGEHILADEDHEWLVRVNRRRNIFALRTTDQVRPGKDGRLHIIEAAGAIELPPRLLTIDPYVLGYWLGNGSTLGSQICTRDEEVIQILSKIEGGHNEYAPNPTGIARHIRIGPHYREDGVTAAETLQSRLRALGLLGNKHIPIEYKRASKEQRLGLLQGLIDSDGYVAKDGQIEYGTQIEQLAKDTRELVHSLGHKASLLYTRATGGGAVPKRDYGPFYLVMFYMKGAARVTRKAIKTRHGIRAFRRYVQAVPAGRGNTVCIQVDSPSHMFLCGKSFLPTHNSELASRKFPAYSLGRKVDRQFISVSATSEFAADFGRDVRNIVSSKEYASLYPTVTLSEDSSAKNKWNTSGGGAYYAVGIGGQIMGRGADLLLIDDPFATMEAAQSPAERKKVWDWYQGSAYNRLQPGGSVVVINHRMHEDDLSGRLLAQQAAGGDKWRVVELPAICDSALDPLGRKPGEALWNEWFPLAALERIRQNTIPRYWSALYQQKPVADEGDYFKAEWLFPYSSAPPLETMRIYGASDYAVKGAGGDYTVHLVVGVDPLGRMYLLDMWRGQKTSDVWIEAFCDLVELWKPLEWAEEMGQIRSAIGPQLKMRQVAREAYVYRRGFPSTADKAVRAQSIRGRMALHGLFVPVAAEWYPEFEREILGFPAGKFDDICDTLGLIGQLLDKMSPGDAATEKPPSRTLGEATLDEIWELQEGGGRVGRI